MPPLLQLVDKVDKLITKRMLAAGLAALLLTATTAGCSSQKDEDASGGSSAVSHTSASAPSSGGTSEGSTLYKDGSYTAEGDYDDQGYKTVVTVTVEDGRLASLSCDQVTADGGSKKELSQSGAYGMKEKGGAAAEWHEEVAAFEAAAVEKGLDNIPTGSDGKTDAISGCTIAVSEFIALARQALDKAE